MRATIDAFYEEADPFVNQFNEWAKELRFAALADHICYKCASANEFEDLRRLFETNSAFIYQSFISNRRIAIVKLPRAIKTHLGPIWFLELSDQKPDGSQSSGFDHVEIYPASSTAAYMIEKIGKRGFPFDRVERPHHTTYDLRFDNGFKIRVEDEPLVEKIKRKEMT